MAFAPGLRCRGHVRPQDERPAEALRLWVLNAGAHGFYGGLGPPGAEADAEAQNQNTIIALTE